MDGADYFFVVMLCIISLGIGFMICGGIIQNNISNLGEKMCNEHNKVLDYVEGGLTEIIIICKEPAKQLEDGYLVLVDVN